MTLLEKIKCFIEGTYPHSWLEDEKWRAHEELNPKKEAKAKKGLTKGKRGLYQKTLGLFKKNRRLPLSTRSDLSTISCYT